MNRHFYSVVSRVLAQHDRLVKLQLMGLSMIHFTNRVAGSPLLKDFHQMCPSNYSHSNVKRMDFVGKVKDIISKGTGLSINSPRSRKSRIDLRIGHGSQIIDLIATTTKQGFAYFTTVLTEISGRSHDRG